MNSKKGRSAALVRCLFPVRVRPFTEAGLWVVLLCFGVRPVVVATAQFAGSPAGWYALDAATRWGAGLAAGSSFNLCHRASFAIFLGCCSSVVPAQNRFLGGWIIPSDYWEATPADCGQMRGHYANVSVWSA